MSSSSSRAAKRASSSESGILRGCAGWIGLVCDFRVGLFFFVLLVGFGTTVLFGFAFVRNLLMWRFELGFSEECVVRKVEVGRSRSGAPLVYGLGTE